MQLFKINLCANNSISIFYVWAEEKNDILIALEETNSDELEWEDCDDCESRPILTIEEDPPVPGRYDLTFVVENDGYGLKQISP